MTKQTEDISEKQDDQTEILEIETHETHVSRVKRKITAKGISSSSIVSELLQGKTLQVYWYLLDNGAASIREIHEALDISSPGLVYYQIQKLVSAGIVSKDDDTNKYLINEKVKTGLLDFYVEIGNLFIPRYSLYISVFLFGFLLFFLSALIWGDPFITNPGTILLFFFLLFGSSVFIYESMKINRLKPN
ncbi:MAG: helix-turn-helix domain-containing protein [Promethearchaeota archaeon]